MRISDLPVFNHEFDESNIIFGIRVPIQLNIKQSIKNMATLKIKVVHFFKNSPKTHIPPTICMVCLKLTKFIFYM